MNCPKRYGSYDVSSVDCNRCSKGLLYQDCTSSKKQTIRHPACAGWNDSAGQPHCCVCYEKNFECSCGFTKEEFMSGVSHVCKHGI